MKKGLIIDRVRRALKSRGISSLPKWLGASIKRKIIGVLIFATFLLASVSTVSAVIYNRQIQKLSSLTDLLFKINSINADVKDALEALNNIKFNSSDEESLAKYQSFQKRMLVLQQIILQRSARESIEDAESLINTQKSFLESANSMIKMVAEDNPEARTFYDEVTRKGDFVREATSALISKELQISLKVKEKIDSDLRRTNIIAIALWVLIILISMLGSLWTTYRITSSLSKLVKAAEEMSVGVVEQTIDVESNDELGKLAVAFRSMMESQRQMAYVATAMSRGDISSDVTLRSPKDILALALQNMISAVRQLVNDASGLSASAVAGDLSVRADSSRHQGDFARIIAGVNSAIDAFTGPIIETAKNIDLLSKGEVPAKIVAEYRGDFNALRDNFNQCIDAVNRLINDARMLNEAALQGNLSVRADASRHSGDFAKIITGVNNTLEAFTVPMRETAVYIARLSKGDIPEEVRFEARGDFNELKENLNRCFESIEKLVFDARMLSRSAVDGKLDTRADATHHSGDYAMIIQGVNDALDALTQPMKLVATFVNRISQGDVPPVITDPWPGDFINLKESLNRCIAAIGLLIKDAAALCASAKVGELSTRADASLHAGAFAEIILGVNSTLDGIVVPVTDISQVLQELANRNLGARVTREYQGDYNILKNATNSVAAQINEAIEKIGSGSKSLSNSAEGLHSIAQRLSQDAQHTSAQANFVSESASEVGKNINSLAIAAQEMDRSVLEIAKYATSATQVAASGVTIAHGMNDLVKILGDRSQEIGQVVKVISAIASQTNLLALNATIESARAGQAGRGFGVVAHEVKELAKGTAQATEEISKKIQAIQASSEHAISSIGEVVEIMNKINEMQTHISSAVEEQHATTSRMSVSVRDAAKGSTEIAEAITSVAQSATESLKIVSESQKSAAEMAQFSLGLEHLIRQFH